VVMVAKKFKKMKKIVILMLGIILMVSCDLTPKQETIDPNSVKIEGVELNSNARWLANKETTDGIKKMQEILNNFPKTASIEKYKVLKTDLEAAFSDIFQKCTMKGESHNQLHNFLKPMLPMFDALESNDAKVREENYDLLRRQLAGYINYFE